MDSINVNLDNLTPDEREQLMKLVEKGNKPKSKVWKPEIGEEYYVPYTTGSIECFTWYDDATDANIYATGNCYRTESEAEFAMERMKVVVELERYAQEHNNGEIDWTGEAVYRLSYDHMDNDIFVENNTILQATATYFTSIEIAENAIKAIGKDRIKKYLFNIEN